MAHADELALGHGDLTGDSYCSQYSSYEAALATDSVTSMDWPLDLLEREEKRETWGDRSLVETGFSVLKYRTMLFRHRFL